MALCEEFTFDNFIIDPFNLGAIEQAKQFANNPHSTSKTNQLVIYGQNAVGKTHLLNAIGNCLKNANPEWIIAVIRASTFTEDLVQHIGENRYKDFNRKYCEEADVLMVDNIHQLCEKEQAQIEMLKIITHYQQAGKKIVLSVLGDLEDLELKNEQLKAILHDSKTIEIKAPIVETAMAILKQKANSFEVYIPQEIIEKAAQAYRHDVRKLVGVALRVDMYRKHLGYDLSKEEIRRLLKLDHLAT